MVRHSDPGVLARGPVRPSVGAGRRDGRLAARCRLTRAGRPLGPAVPDGLVGPLLERDDRNGPSGGTAGLKGHISITMEFASRTISPSLVMLSPPNQYYPGRRTMIHLDSCQPGKFFDVRLNSTPIRSS